MADTFPERYKDYRARHPWFTAFILSVGVYDLMLFAVTIGLLVGVSL